ncbi:MAG: 3-phosphoshikimate 1-carboxyvinyltransferase [Clostridia bacterium]|nr:3-phosphoshikimate 1-carboxyvinyltransferase [Clostridia bacterium]
MDKTFYKSHVKREIRAISSKSEAHRYLICAALGDRVCEIVCTDTNADIDATAECLNALGADIQRTADGFLVNPISEIRKNQILDCNESGSTLRFLLPLASALGANCQFIMRGRLANRPLSPLYELLCSNGMSLSPQGVSPLEVKGKIPAGNYSVAANVSSQYISGLLFALSVAEGDSTLTLEEKIESAPYIGMTLDALLAFGANVTFDESTGAFKIKGKRRLTSPERLTVGGDWSNAAFPLVAGAIGESSVNVYGLDLNSRQGDRRILTVLQRMGALITYNNDSITVHPSPLSGIEIDAADIPDLVPILAVAASVANGETRIFNAARLRLKESDRIESVCSTLSSLGAEIIATNDGMIIRGQKILSGGTVDSYNDHRIAMSAAIASLVCSSPVTISGFEAINKSYPTFLNCWEE